MKYFNSVKLPVKIATCVCAFFGLLYLIWPAFTLNFMRILLGIALIAFGGLKIYTYVKDVKKPGLPKPNAALGCALVVLGIFMFLSFAVFTVDGAVHTTGELAAELGSLGAMGGAIGQMLGALLSVMTAMNTVSYFALLIGIVFATAYLLQRTYDLFKSHVQLWYVPACAGFVGLVLLILNFCIGSNILLGLSVFFMALFVLACDVFIAYVSEDKPAAPVAAPVAEPEPEVTELEEL